MLIQNHSHHKLTERMAAAGAFVVVTLSPQSVASIANLLGLSFADCFRVLATALKSCGVRYVLDAASGGDVALVEAREQFIRRYCGLYDDTVSSICPLVLLLYIHRICGV